MVSLEEAKKALQNGKLLIYPTDTVWGMGCDASNQKAVDKLFELKGKKQDGMSVMFNNKEQIYNTCNTNKKARKIIEEFLPGPVTLILKSKKEFAKGVTRNGNLGVRMPLNETSTQLAKELPVITTSVNLHGHEIAKTLDEAEKIFGNNCIYLDGEKPKGIESTIINLTNDEPEITRIGALYSTILEGILES